MRQGKWKTWTDFETTFAFCFCAFFPFTLTPRIHLFGSIYNRISKQCSLAYVSIIYLVFQVFNSKSTALTTIQLCCIWREARAGTSIKRAFIRIHHALLLVLQSFGMQSKCVLSPFAHCNEMMRGISLYPLVWCIRNSEQIRIEIE